jgi:hypothetical protein
MIYDMDYTNCTKYIVTIQPYGLYNKLCTQSAKEHFGVDRSENEKKLCNQFLSMWTIRLVHGMFLDWYGFHPKA